VKLYAARALARLANAGAQQTSLILYADLAAAQKIRDGCHHLCAATSARTDCQDQITERKPSARSDDLAQLRISFHILTVFVLSRSDASVLCEYVVHGVSAVVHFLCTIELTVA
jgi:hypothetical protein